jgi:hypothetical protein
MTKLDRPEKNPRWRTEANNYHYIYRSKPERDIDGEHVICADDMPPRYDLSVATSQPTPASRRDRLLQIQAKLKAEVGQQQKAANQQKSANQRPVVHAMQMPSSPSQRNNNNNNKNNNKNNQNTNSHVPLHGPNVPQALPSPPTVHVVDARPPSDEEIENESEENTVDPLLEGLPPFLQNFRINGNIPHPERELSTLELFMTGMILAIAFSSFVLLIVFLWGLYRHCRGRGGACTSVTRAFLNCFHSSCDSLNDMFGSGGGPGLRNTRLITQRRVLALLMYLVYVLIILYFVL